MTVAKSQTTETIETKTSAQLESEIETRRTDIERLREAIATLEAGRIRPLNPNADSAFALLVELVGSAPERLEDKQGYEAKLEAAELSLKLAIEICEQKSKELKTLQQQNRQGQADVLAQQLIEKAQEYNTFIDSSFELLAEMKLLSSEIIRLRGDRIQVFEIVADINETPFCQIGGDRVKVRRRFDIKR